MKVNEMQKMICQTVRREFSLAVDAYARAVADVAACVAAKNVWDNFNPDDGVGGFSLCPYRPGSREECMDKSKKHLDRWEEVYNYTVETFLGDNDENAHTE